MPHPHRPEYRSSSVAGYLYNTLLNSGLLWGFDEIEKAEHAIHVGGQRCTDFSADELMVRRSKPWAKREVSTNYTVSLLS
jgi:hypothetical protein